MRRRTFLKKAAAAAAAPFVAGRIGNATAGARSIQHVVLIMMENRSLDHFLGWLPNADGKQAGLSYADRSGTVHNTFPLAPDFTGCSYPDPDHSYTGARTEYDNGAMDGFLKVQANTVYPIGYYTEANIPFLAALARNYTTCDRYFPSILGPTFPNRIFQHAGQTDRLSDSLTISTLPTIWDHLAAQGVSHGYYFSNVPFVALWGTKYLGISHTHSQFLSDCAAGTLPAVSYVDPGFTLVGNLGTDDHPHSDIRNGDAFLAKTFHAIAQSPNWANTVVVINFDEWGGFFDHIVPPRALAPNNVDPDLVNGKALLGIRVPCIVASPWTRGNPLNPRVNSTVFDHTSVLKLIEWNWNVPPLAARETSSDVGNIVDVLDLSNPRVDVPSLPNPSYVIPSSFCSSNPLASSASVGLEPSGFAGMLSSGMLKGFPGF